MAIILIIAIAVVVYIFVTRSANGAKKRDLEFVALQVRELAAPETLALSRIMKGRVVQQGLALAAPLANIG